MTEDIDAGAKTNERNSLYGCKFCPMLGKDMKTRSAIEEGRHNQNVYRAMRGHSVECRTKVLKTGATPADQSAAPVKLCGYCLKSFSDAHIAGDHSLTCADGPAIAQPTPAPAKPRPVKKATKSKKATAPAKKGKKGKKAKK